MSQVKHNSSLLRTYTYVAVCISTYTNTYTVCVILQHTATLLQHTATLLQHTATAPMAAVMFDLAHTYTYVMSCTCECMSMKGGRICVRYIVGQEKKKCICVYMFEIYRWPRKKEMYMCHTATHCNTKKERNVYVSHCNTLQHQERKKCICVRNIVLPIYLTHIQIQLKGQERKTHKYISHIYIHLSQTQPVPWKMRLGMVIGMQNEILIGIKKLPFYVSFQIFK